MSTRMLGEIYWDKYYGFKFLWGKKLAISVKGKKLPDPWPISHGTGFHFCTFCFHKMAALFLIGARCFEWSMLQPWHHNTLHMSPRIRECVKFSLNIFLAANFCEKSLAISVKKKNCLTLGQLGNTQVNLDPNHENIALGCSPNTSLLLVGQRCTVTELTGQGHRQHCLDMQVSACTFAFTRWQHQHFTLE